MGSCNSADGVCAGGTADKVQDTESPQRRTKRRKAPKHSKKTRSEDDLMYDTDDDDGEATPIRHDVLSQFENAAKGSDEILAMSLIDQHHDVDWVSFIFHCKADCLRLAVRSELPRLVLFLLEEGLSVK